MKGYFYTETGVPVPKMPVELKGDLESSVELALKKFESNNIKLKEKSVAWALLSLSFKVLVASKSKDKKDKAITLNGRLLICD